MAHLSGRQPGRRPQGAPEVTHSAVTERRSALRPCFKEHLWETKIAPVVRGLHTGNATETCKSASVRREHECLALGGCSSLSWCRFSAWARADNLLVHQ
ncbi:uncharacterized protein ACOB7L_026425 isoform 2-T3 [Callospermophilus lateralis]|uniref:uncharacterized protein LOC143412244 isoform X2 n=1 Tax=Callospermophilus lateralis TaxID=76772 RepID=UPI004038F0E6